jgi:hypothetical protein
MPRQLIEGIQVLFDLIDRHACRPGVVVVVAMRGSWSYHTLRTIGHTSTW